jgi:glycosyltransferase involved in cell wall biosynthesis
MNKEVSIILSTYNEATVIEDTINQIFKNLDNVEIILVDDNSTDETFEKVIKMNNPNIKAYSRATRGLASAFLLGLINSSSNTVGWLDSNMGNLAKRLPEMKKQLEKNDLVILSRYVDGGLDQRSRLRILSSKLINFLCQAILSNKIKDYTSSIFLMKRDVLLSVVPISTGHGEFFIEFLYKAINSGKKIIELPYTHPPDVEGMSKTASSFYRFIKLGSIYLIRIFQSLLNRN